MERRITLSSSELEIQENTNSTICIKWSPKEVGCWRDVLQLTDSRRIKYDVVIATTAKDDKRSNKTRRRPKLALSLSNSVNLSTTTVNKQFQNNMKVSTFGQPLINNLDIQVKQCRSKYKSELNKENILNKNNEMRTCVKDERINEHDKLENIMCEQGMNVWTDSSILPLLHPSSGPQDIRRATYIKERRPCSSILYEHNEGIDQNAECDKDKVQSDFSILLNKFTFTSTDVIASSPELAKRELTDTTSQAVDKHKTFNISHGLFETSTILDTKTFINAIPALQPVGLHNLSPIKPNGCSLITNIKDLISSSPIQFQHHVIPKEPKQDWVS